MSPPRLAHSCLGFGWFSVGSHLLIGLEVARPWMTYTLGDYTGILLRHNVFKNKLNEYSKATIALYTAEEDKHSTLAIALRCTRFNLSPEIVAPSSASRSPDLYTPLATFPVHVSNQWCLCLGYLSQMRYGTYTYSSGYCPRLTLGSLAELFALTTRRYKGKQIVLIREILLQTLHPKQTSNTCSSQTKIIL